jgi:hypothetical protein
VIFFRIIFKRNEEDDVRTGIILAVGGLLLLSGCGNAGNAGTGIPVQPKWKGAPYRLAFDTKAAKTGPTGIDLPAIKFTANPDALETRAVLVLRFTASEANSDPGEHLIIGTPVDIRGEEGTIPEDYMERARKGLSDYLGQHCLKGKVDVSVALARSSLNPQSGEDQVDGKRLSGWLPLEIVFKNPHSKCK